MCVRSEILPAVKVLYVGHNLWSLNSGQYFGGTHLLHLQGKRLQRDKSFHSCSNNIRCVCLVTGSGRDIVFSDSETLRVEEYIYGSTDMNSELGSSVGIVSDYGLDGRGSIPDKGRGFFL
jgi:hypothetical protein